MSAWHKELMSYLLVQCFEWETFDVPLDYGMLTSLLDPGKIFPALPQDLPQVLTCYLTPPVDMENLVVSLLGNVIFLGLVKLTHGWNRSCDLLSFI